MCGCLGGSDSPEPEFWTLCELGTWVLGIKLGSSERNITINLGAISPSDEVCRFVWITAVLHSHAGTLCSSLKYAGAE